MTEIVQSGFGLRWFYALWKFSRPHTIIGTSFSVLGVYLIAISLFPISHPPFSLFASWISCLCGNVYIVGLNQLQDVEIDKINKPKLPLASGEFSLQMGKFIVTVTGILALLLAWLQGPFLLGMVAISLTIGTAYSLPPIRLKRFYFWAALCIFSVRGAIVNLGLFLHFCWLWGKQPIIAPAVWVLTLFVLVFTFAIAIFKDIPDLEGDRLYNITTFTIKLGKKAVFNLARWVLTFCYGGMILLGVVGLPGVNRIFLIVSHIAAMVIMWWLSRKVDLDDKVSIAKYYQFIWKLFFLEYLMFPIACLLA
ncbi:MAG: homogentisate phytyltransferase [Nostocaceae cyanobacterium]|nr:homogentisate phytyltransferase [Nostocaceae cyanobacterium]